jgi:hypothetical protein
MEAVAVEVIGRDDELASIAGFRKRSRTSTCSSGRRRFRTWA